jgi:hypothetical protein
MYKFLTLFKFLLNKKTKTAFYRRYYLLIENLRDYWLFKYYKNYGIIFALIYIGMKILEEAFQEIITHSI